MQLVAQTIAATAPTVVAEVKKRAPGVWARAQKYLQSSGGQIDAVVSAASGGNNAMGAALFETLTHPKVAGRDAEEVFRAIAAASPNLNTDYLKSAAAELTRLKSHEFANATQHHAALPSNDSAVRMAEVTRAVGVARRILGVTEKEVAELLTFFANFGPEDVAALRAFEIASGRRTA